MMRALQKLSALLAIALALAVAHGCGEDVGASSTAAVDAGPGADATPADGAAADATDQEIAVVPDVVGEDAAPDAEPVDAPPAVCSEAQFAACDDKLACTTNDCTLPYAVCKWTLQPDHCLIGGQCRAKGEAKPGDPCRSCDPAQDAHGWSLAADVSPCDDGKPCTFNDHCAAGACLGEAVVCGDSNPCTSDACDAQKGCIYPLLSGPACDDGSACSSGDLCVAGICQGTVVLCDDKNPCTDDSCDLAKGCTHTDNSTPCSDGDACTAGDGCSAGACKAGAVANCDDGNTCTLEVCDPDSGCYHLPTKSPCCTGVVSICDDGNPCTSDDCAAGGGCSHVNNSAPCNDGNACTASDVCAGGNCKGAVKTCNDKNPCTADACSTQKGCIFSPLDSGACDDGNPCTLGDACGAGTCKGTGQCACTPTFAKQASKLTYLAIGTGGKPGEGLDLDENPKTCAPEGCSGGIDNSLGALASVANGPLDKAVQGGSVLLILEYKDFKQGPINLALYQASLDAANSTCDVQSQSCVYQVAKSMIDPQKCTPTVALAGTLTGNALVAGGKGTNFPFSLPIQPGVNLNITIFGARLQGTVTLKDGVPSTLDGILAGAVPKESLLQAVDALPDEGLPIPKEGLTAILDATVINDIDTDGDGKKDAASIGLKLKGIAATISGAK